MEIVNDLWDIFLKTIFESRRSQKRQICLKLWIELLRPDLNAIERVLNTFKFNLESVHLILI